MEALLLAGGRGERLGNAADGLPKPLVPIGGRPLAVYMVARLVAAGVTRVIVGCAAGNEQLFAETLSGLGLDVEAIGEDEPLGRGGGLRHAAARRRESGPVYALNGDELVDVDLGLLLEQHDRTGAAATITVVPLQSPFGVVELDGHRVVGFQEAPRLPHWVSCGVYVLGEEALDRLPERGDHERSTFPDLAREGKLHAFTHEGRWLTVNTPKDLRQAEEFLNDHPGWLAE
jgi:NDP-sugar pyrophosphorylase family protein